MMTLVINAGSSSLKYQLIEMETETSLVQGLCERIGIDGRIIHKYNGEKHTYDIPLENHKVALDKVVELLTTGETACIKDKSDIVAIGHRMASGLDIIVESVEITDDVLKLVEETKNLAPLHIPAMIMAVKACQQIFSNSLQVAVFDNSFHSTLPPKAYTYGIPYEYYEKHHLRKYGYHGTSHRYVVQRLATLMGKNVEDLKVVSCHLGNGSSVTAINGGKSVDTTMGYTPADGLIMGTRCGSMDPTVVEHMANFENLSLSEVMSVLNKKSGFLGISGVSSDTREVEAAANDGNKRAQLALEVLEYQIQKYIGSFAAAMNGLDAIIFTGGIGENSDTVRKAVCSNMDFFGIKLDDSKNQTVNHSEGEISADDSKVKVFIIPTNEELMMARDAYSIYLKKNQ